jgi:adenylyltransferase/sulfurtransferase
VAGDAPCYRCLYPEPPPAIMAPTCAEGGVLGVLPGLVGTVMATEVLKVLLGIGETLAGRLLLVDALTMQFRQVRVRRDPGCPACGTRTLADDIDYDLFCAGEATPHATDVPEVSARTLAAWRTADVPHLLLDVREPSEWAIGHIDGARLVPLGALEGALPSLPRDTDIVVMCRAGARSATAVRQLHAAGITRAVSLAGGIVRWADEVDPTMPRY